MSNILKEQKEKLLGLLKSAIAQDQALRDQHKIGDKFKFIRDRLHSLLARVEEGLSTIKDETEDTKRALTEDEVLIYVYLFNAQGLVFQTWKKLVNQSVFYEYSVNRPIYLDKSHVEAIIRSKTNKAQHGYLTVSIRKEFILKAADVEVKDSLGNPVVKVKEGTLKIENLQSFTHNHHDYTVTAEGEIIKKIS